MLRRRENGDCIYLAEGGCSIHGRAPKVCQEYDCRLDFLNTPPEERLRQVRAGEAPVAIFKAGHKRLHTLTGRGEAGRTEQHERIAPDALSDWALPPPAARESGEAEPIRVFESSLHRPPPLADPEEQRARPMHTGDLPGDLG